jgi:hypothetical protein
MTAAATLSTAVLTRVGDHRRASLKPVRQVFRWLMGTDPHPSDKQTSDLVAWMMKGDPLADAVIQTYKSLPGGAGRKLFEQALERGIGSLDNPPEALVALFAQVDEVPAWVDHDLLREGADVARRVGPWGELVLRNLSLMGGYLGSAAAKPLVFTGQLDKVAARRLVETGKFWMDVNAPGGLDRHAEGFKSALRVRLMHAQVRVMLLQSGKWRLEWGYPLNQFDTMATVLEFSSIYLTGLRALGFLFTKREREAVIHLWRYIGYLMGVDERILPAHEHDSMKALYCVIATMGEADEDTKALGTALANASWQFAGDSAMAQRLAGIERTLRIGYTRYVLGDEAGDKLGLERTLTKYLWPAQIPLRVGAELVRKSLPGADRLLLAWNDHLSRKRFPENVVKQGADVTFTPVKALVR